MTIPKEIPAGQFKAQCLKLMDDVSKHQLELVITKRGKPVAKLVSVKEEENKTYFGCMGGTAKWLGRDDVWLISESSDDDISTSDDDDDILAIGDTDSSMVVPEAANQSDAENITKKILPSVNAWTQRRVDIVKNASKGGNAW